MTHSEVHLGVRNVLRASPFRKFVVVVESVEDDNGGVVVEWRIAITDATPMMYFRGRNPYELLAEVRSTVDALRKTEPAPADLESIGVPPTPRRVG